MGHCSSYQWRSTWGHACMTEIVRSWFGCVQCTMTTMRTWWRMTTRYKRRGQKMSVTAMRTMPPTCPRTMRPLRPGMHPLPPRSWGPRGPTCSCWDPPPAATSPWDGCVSLRCLTTWQPPVLSLAHRKVSEGRKGLFLFRSHHCPTLQSFFGSQKLCAASHARSAAQDWQVGEQVLLPRRRLWPPSPDPPSGGGLDLISPPSPLPHAAGSSH